MLGDKLTSDSLLWDAFKEGDKEAYATIYERYAGAMYAYGLRFTTAEELIEDSIHDIFVRIYDNRKKLPQVSNIKLYLFIALRNSLYTTFSDNKNEFRLDISDSIALHDPDNIENRIIENETEAINRELVSRIDTILSFRQKQIIYYRYVEQLSYKEIALLMGITIQSAKNMVQISLKKIRSSFSGSISLLIIAILFGW